MYEGGVDGWWLRQRVVEWYGMAENGGKLRQRIVWLIRDCVCSLMCAAKVYIYREGLGTAGREFRSV